MIRSHVSMILFFGAATLLACGKSQSEQTAASTSASGRLEGDRAPKELELLNVSYDPTREVWREINQSFSLAYQKASGVKVSIKQSHGGSKSPSGNLDQIII